MGGLIPDSWSQAETAIVCRRFFGVVAWHVARWASGRLRGAPIVGPSFRQLLNLRRRAGHPLKPQVLDDERLFCRAGCVNIAYERSATMPCSLVEGSK